MTGQHRTLAYSMAAARAGRRPASARCDPAVGMAIIAVALATAMLLASLPGMAAVPASDVAPAPVAAPQPELAALARHR